MPHRRQQPSRIKRVLVLALGHTMAAVAITIAITWTLALARPVSDNLVSSVVRIVSFRPRSPARGEGTGWLTITRFSVPGAWFAESYVQPAEGEGSTPEEPTPGAVTPEQIVPVWAFRQLTPHRPEDWPTDDSTWTAMIDARGWPLPALWCGYTYETDANFRVLAAPHGAIEVGGWKTRKGAWSGAYPVALPLRPWWPGLLANSAITAGALVVLVHGPRRIRRWRRRSAGLCTTCGYDLSAIAHAAPCPECGAAGPRTRSREVRPRA
ncbi:MAG: hypothetical protein IT438_17015 [Phycisphaerales bacterium]|nr:hypothetical protein [Phycisphaerales bacterium]